VIDEEANPVGTNISAAKPQPKNDWNTNGTSKRGARDEGR